ncbi:nucleolar and coiled-body phosphoprotein 1-like [Hydractinia symbiolongicarpus]|uniref:nucleolar and coiled-body phosphoprotein 1-like n=1 Tax=Hydractinia symbiolongicarpus TaxID=13093 RepID=UPI00254E07C1|nr:nucleolar and coiled-body phosphoprotein 1-like [Hydractinia symbiolongicarpus]
MSFQTIDSVIPLIYGWLKENHLLRTSRSLEEEYGKDIKTNDDVTLTQIVACYGAMAILFSKPDTKSTKKVKKPSKAKKFTKTGDKSADEVDKSKKTNDKKSKGDTNLQSSEEVTVTEKKVKKKEKPKPFVPHEWICPEMEEKLAGVYDRIITASQLDQQNNNVEKDNGVKTNSKNEANAKAGHDKTSSQHIPSFDSDSSCVEVPKKNVSKIHNSDTDTTSSDENEIPKKKIISRTPQKTVTNSDTSSESESETTKPKKTLVRLANGTVLESPYVPPQLPAKMETKKKIKKYEAEDEDMDQEELIKKKKKKKKKTDEEDVEIPETKKRKHEKKSDDLIDDAKKKKLSNETSETTITEEDELDENKKKKKKKKKKKNVEEASEDTEEDETSEKKKKKKKKKKQHEAEETSTPTKTKEDEEMVVSQSTKKSKKVKTPFRRVVEEEVVVPEALQDNSYEAKKGKAGDYGEKANEVLKYTKGKSFRHEKTKKKRGSYGGGLITQEVNSIQFSSD